MKSFNKVFDGRAVPRNSETLFEFYFFLKDFSVWKKTKKKRIFYLLLL